VRHTATFRGGNPGGNAQATKGTTAYIFDDGMRFLGREPVDAGWLLAGIAAPEHRDGGFLPLEKREIFIMMV